MIGAAWWQAILDGLGQVLAFLYGLIPNYGVAIILLTVLIRVLLLPLAVKQIRSMQSMQAIQPKVKAIQQKYKGKPDGRQKINEETMALYREHGVSPFGGCLPLLLQFPVLIALFAVLRVPTGIGHIPSTSRLHAAIVRQDTHFLGSNLLCSAQQAGKTVKLVNKAGKPDPVIPQLNCGSGAAVRIPYYIFALLMIGTTYYQQRQMQRATPAGASQQQQALTRIMPLLFGFWGFLFPAGLVIYWTTTNVLQIAQQHYMLPSPAAGDGSGDGAKKLGGKGPASPPGNRGGARGGRGPAGPRASGGDRERSSGGRDGGSRKKRRKR